MRSNGTSSRHCYNVGGPSIGPADGRKCVDISIIIVSYNTRDVTLACVRSVFERAHGCSWEVILIDNDSKDGSVEAIREAYPEVLIIENADNRGFAAANNQGLRIARGRYLLLLNPDTEVYPETLSKTLEYAEANPRLGVIGCRVFGDDGKQQSTLFRVKRVSDVAINAFIPNRVMRRTRWLGRCRYAGIDLNCEHAVEIVAGCFMFVRRTAFEEVGEMDEAFFMYGEEAEWCHRFRRHGWGVQYFPGASILHYGGISTDRHPAEMNLAMARSNLLLVQRTSGRLAAYCANLFMLLRDLPRAAAWQALAPFMRGKESATARSLRQAAARTVLHLSGLIRFNWNP